MKKVSAILTVLLVSLVAWAQEQDQQGPPPAGPMEGQTQGIGEAHRPGRRGPGTAGKITAIDGNTITINTFDGKSSQVNVTDSTRFRKDRNEAKLADFKVGDNVFVRGQQTSEGVYQAEVLASRSGGPGGPMNFREGMGKQFIAGEIKSIDGTQLTIQRPDGVTQTITVDQNTSFRKQGESITVADLKPGDHVFGRGELKNDIFVPTTLNVGQPGMMRKGGQGNWRQQQPQ
jgi:hypothetical protein